MGVFLAMNKRGQVALHARRHGALVRHGGSSHGGNCRRAGLFAIDRRERSSFKRRCFRWGRACLMIESTGHISLLNPAARALLNLPPTAVATVFTFEDAIKNADIVELLREATQNGHEGTAEIEVELPQSGRRPHLPSTNRVRARRKSGRARDSGRRRHLQRHHRDSQRGQDENRLCLDGFARTAHAAHLDQGLHFDAPPRHRRVFRPRLPARILHHHRQRVRPFAPLDRRLCSTCRASNRAARCK